MLATTCDRVVVAVPAGYESEPDRVTGGASRSASVHAALRAAPEAEVVVVHDAARPLVPRELVERCIEGARGADGAIAAAPVTDTIKEVTAAGIVARTLDRSVLWAVQTPQVFRRAALERALAALAELDLDLDDIEGARRFLAMAPQAKANDPAIAGARAAIELAEQAASLGDLADLKRRLDSDPLDHQARFDLALGLNARGKRAEALEQLLDIVRRDRSWNEDGARKQLVQFFEAWGPTDPNTVAGRRKLSSILFA